MLACAGLDRYLSAWRLLRRAEPQSSDSAASYALLMRKPELDGRRRATRNALTDNLRGCASRQPCKCAHCRPGALHVFGDLFNGSHRFRQTHPFVAVVALDGLGVLASLIPS